MLTKLLVGDAVELKPDSELRFPPTVAGENGRRYDTVTGTTNGSKVYVVYENGMCQEPCANTAANEMLLHLEPYPSGDMSCLRVDS